MSTHEIPIPDADKEILADNVLGVLSTIRAEDGLISSNPVGYFFDGQGVRISTLKSRVKYSNIEANPSVAFCVVDQADGNRYVELRGHATLEDDLDRAFLRRSFPQMTGGVELPDDLDPPGAERAVIRIHPHQVSGRYGGRFTADRLPSGNARS